MKRIVFFDGDGTLWYPESTRYTQPPHWVYTDPETNINPAKHLVLTPNCLSTLEQLKKQGVISIVLSAYPRDHDEGNQILKIKVDHFGLTNLFTETHATHTYKESKGEFILELLEKYRIPKKHALMVGDTYDWDYKPAREVGTDALLIDSKYRKNSPGGRRAKHLIENLSQILRYI